MQEASIDRNDFSSLSDDAPRKALFSPNNGDAAPSKARSPTRRMSGGRGLSAAVISIALFSATLFIVVLVEAEEEAHALVRVGARQDSSSFHESHEVPRNDSTRQAGNISVPTPPMSNNTKEAETALVPIRSPSDTPFQGSHDPARSDLWVAVHMVGFLNWFLDPKGRETVVRHLLGPYNRTTNMQAFLCTDTKLIHFIPEGLMEELDIVLFHKIFPGRRQFFRKAWCYEQVAEWATNRSIQFDWIVQTRPDMIFFEDAPDVRELSRDRVYGRMRAAGMNFTRRWRLNSLHFSHAFSVPWEVGCWGRLLEWQQECVIFDDQFALIPWQFGRVLNQPGQEWGGFVRNSLTMEDRHVSSIAGNRTALKVGALYKEPSAEYTLCKASFPGEGYFSREMATNNVPFQPLELNACLGKNVWHPIRRRWDCAIETRMERGKWFREVDCFTAPNHEKPLFEEWENHAHLCNVSAKKYTGDAAC